MHILYYIIKYNIIYNIMNIVSKIYNFFNNIYKALNDQKLKYISLYLFVSLFCLVSYTAPTFGYDLLNQKMFQGINIGIVEKIGFGSAEIYFYLGFTVIYIILLFIVIYNRIDKCIIEYRKLDPKYEKYSALDFIKNNVSKVLLDVFKKTIGIIIVPFFIFILSTIAYLVLNNVGKIAVPLKLVSFIVNVGMVIIVPILNIVLFILYYVIVDANIPC
jgi:hypothetical protein